MKKSLYAGLTALLFSGVALAQPSFNGYALFNDMGETTTYLIDKDGNIAKTWNSTIECNYSVKLKDNGNIVRGGVDWNSPLFGPAGGGILQEIDPNGNVVWQFDYSSAQHLSHHDIEVLPNGNVLMIAWEVKSSAELTQAGYSGTVANGLWPTHIIEVQQNGSSGQIVWEWHIWDHLIQDHDASKDNYGVVADHPELMDINAVTPFDPSGFLGDWFHVNGINYNADLDQIVFSSRTANEFFIIDHSTTTAEAASHSGGNSGMGGDFLFRWGNASNYGQSGQIIPAAVHDPRWIPNDGRPNAGYIQFFNNEGGSGFENSVVDAINPPVNGYLYDLTNNVYGPTSEDWRHDTHVNSTGQSASARLSNGNTFVAVSGEYMYEVNDGGNTVWQYNAGPAKAFRYECDHPGIIALLGQDPCGWMSVTEESLDQLSFYPNPSENGMFTIEGMNTADLDVKIIVQDMFGKTVFTSGSAQTIDLSMCSAGIYYVSLDFGNGNNVTKKISKL